MIRSIPVVRRACLLDHHDRHTGRLYDPDRLTHAGVKRMRAILRAVKPLADDFDALSMGTAVIFLGRRKWLCDITRRPSRVTGLGGTYAPPPCLPHHHERLWPSQFLRVAQPHLA